VPPGFLLGLVPLFCYAGRMREHRLILAVDGGGSKTRAALSTVEGTLLGELTGGPCNLFQDAAGGLAELRALWQGLAAAARLDAAADACRTVISAGLAGASLEGSRQRFAAAFADFASRHLSTDGYIALLGATDGRPGGLLAIGTGVVGYRLTAAGAVRTLGGWGFPFGDRGSGAWLGWRAIGDWLEVRDGYGTFPESRLWAALDARLGRSTGEILGWFKAARPAELAALAPLVVDGAADGDAAADALIDEATGHHRRLAAALAPSPAEPLVLAGGLAPVFRAALEAELGEALAAATVTAAPLDGARLIALGHNPAEFNAP
jgi:glucosamine kinase